MRTTWLFSVLLASAALGCMASAGDARPHPARSAEAVRADALDASRAIDGAIDAAWAAAGLTPAPDVDDATFARRTSLDLVGRIPTSGELGTFLADPGADRRARWVDRLLASPEHDTHLARTWELILLGRETKNRALDVAAFRRFLADRFAKNTPWDQIVREIVTADGRTSLGGDVGPTAFADDPARAEEERAAGINGATNFFVRFAKSPADLAGTTSKAFLGVQIQCAQCHDHKSESWTQDDFRGFASSLLHVQAKPIEREKGRMSVFELGDADRLPRRMLRDEALSKIADTDPRALDGTDLGSGADARDALAQWMTSKENPYFARAMANRVWGELIGQGLTEPVDDMRASNPPVLPEVLDALAARFVKTGFDLDDLYRTVALTRAYARGVTPGKGTARDALFSRADLRPLSSDALLDSYFAATDMDDVLDAKAPARAAVLKAQIRRRLGFVFEEDSESNGATFDGTMQQALFEMNGPLTAAATGFSEGSAIARAVRGRADAAAVDELWMRTLGRHPTTEEAARALAFVTAPTPAEPEEEAVTRPATIGGGGKGKGKRGGALPPAVVRSSAKSDRERAYEDLFWALLNSSEFNLRR